MSGIENELREQDLVAATVYLHSPEVDRRSAWLAFVALRGVSNSQTSVDGGNQLTRNRHMAATQCWTSQQGGVAERYFEERPILGGGTESWQEP